MYRRLMLAAMLGLVTALGGPVAYQHMLTAPMQFDVRRKVRQRLGFVRSGTPRGCTKHERQKPPHKNCQHRKPARARRRKARLKGGRG